MHVPSLVINLSQSKEGANEYTPASAPAPLPMYLST